MYNATQEQLLRDFADASDQLLHLGIIRTDSFLGEIAEYYACKTYQLKLAPKVSANYDAFCDQGEKYQVKSIIRKTDSYRYVFDKKKTCTFDYLVVVWFNEQLLPEKIVKVKASGQPQKIIVASEALQNSIDLFRIKIPASHKKAIFHFASLYKNMYSTGIVRSKRIVGDIGEYYACKKLHLKICDKQNQKGYDATDNDGKTYEIKCRRIYESPRRTSDSRRLNNLTGKSADFLIVVAIDREFTCAGMWLIPFKNINVKNVHIDIVNDALGVITVVKSRIPWLKDSSVIFSHPKTVISRVTRRKRSSNGRSMRRKVIPQENEMLQVAPIQTHQEREIEESSSTPVWLFIFVAGIILVLYFFTRLH